MDVSIFLIDPSGEGVLRDEARFNHLIELILGTEIKEINLVSQRPAEYEAVFLNRIPAKIFKTEGLLNKIRTTKLRKRHLHADQFDLGFLLNQIGQGIKNEALIYYEDDPNDLAYDGTDMINKFLKIFNARRGSILGMKKIDFAEISGFDLLKGNLLSEGEYQIRSAFRVDTALQASSNLAVTKRFMFTPFFFQVLSHNMLVNQKTAFVESIDRLARTRPVFGCLPFYPIRIKSGF